MNIGVDIDGVLTDFESFVLIKGGRYFSKKRNMHIINPEGFDVDQVFGVTKKQLLRFWMRHYFAYCITQPARIGAKESLKKLKKDGNKIVIITGRMLSYEKNLIGAIMRMSVKFWLWKNGIKYDSIVFCQENDKKTEICKHLNIDIMIEDKPDNVMALLDSMPVICFDASYNRGFDAESIKRVKSWNEIYDCLEEL